MSDETPDCVVADHWVDAEIGGTQSGSPCEIEFAAALRREATP